MDQCDLQQPVGLLAIQRPATERSDRIASMQSAEIQRGMNCQCVPRCRGHASADTSSVLDFPLFLAAFLLRVTLVLPALSIALVVFGPAVDFA